MPKSQPRAFNFGQALKKIVVSTFVVFTFVAYAIHDRLSGSNGAVVAAPTLGSSAVGNNPVAGDVQQPAVQPQPSDTSVQPAPNTSTQSGYRDGQYTGNVADAYYGNVQVRATIQGGRLADVQFLTYPSDRR